MRPLARCQGQRCFVAAFIFPSWSSLEISRSRAGVALDREPLRRMPRTYAAWGRAFSALITEIFISHSSPDTLTVRKPILR